MRKSKLIYWQLWKQQILCLLSREDGERQHWKSPLWCLSEPWEGTSTAAKGVTWGQHHHPGLITYWITMLYSKPCCLFFFCLCFPLKNHFYMQSSLFLTIQFILNFFFLFQIPQKIKQYWHSKRRNTVNSYVSKQHFFLFCIGFWVYQNIYLWEWLYSVPGGSPITH